MEGTAFSIEEAGFDASWPRSARSCSNAGSMRLGDKAKARQALEAAIELEPQNSFALRSLGSLLVLPGAFAAGVARFRQALAVAPGDLITTYNLAQALLEHDPEEHRSAGPDPPSPATSPAGDALAAAARGPDALQPPSSSSDPHPAAAGGEGPGGVDASSSRRCTGGGGCQGKPPAQARKGANGKLCSRA